MALQQQTIQFKSFLKRSVVNALLASFAAYTDPTLAATKIGIDYTMDDFKLPAIIVKFNETQLPNAGVGHYEWFVSPNDPNPSTPTEFVQYQHRFYKGTVELEIFAESSADRDILSDALIDILAMDEVSAGGTAFINQFYNLIQNTPYGLWHFPTLNLDLIDPLGESYVMPPWNPEDQGVYQTGYRVPVFGEFYSYTPKTPTSTGPITEVDVYGYNPDFDPLPAKAPSSAYTKYTGFPPGSKNVPTQD